MLQKLAALVAVQEASVPPSSPWQVQEAVEPSRAARVTLVGLAVPEEHIFVLMVLAELV